MPPDLAARRYGIDQTRFKLAIRQAVARPPGSGHPVKINQIQIEGEQVERHDQRGLLHQPYDDCHTRRANEQSQNNTNAIFRLAATLPSN